MEKDDFIPLFETKRMKGRFIYRLFALSIFVSIVLVWVYRAINIPSEYGSRLVWMMMFAAELWFGLYWILTQSVRWNKIYRVPFKERLSQRFEEELPCVDVFVCTADPTIEPPIMVINTVLSVMAYDYPPEKLSVYLSDDAGSQITFYALLEASRFSKQWLPYCKKYNVEPRSPAAYFSAFPQKDDADQASEYYLIKNLYADMENRIELASRAGRVSQEAQAGHGGFLNWHSYFSKGDHDTILQILINGDNSDDKDVEGCSLPTLVYLAREKRPRHFHNFKAGAMNALIRVSSEISNAPIILNVDCDMYSNNSQAVRDALCFFMDERQGNEIAFVQFPQNYENVTKNDLYGNSLLIIAQVDFCGIDGHGGPLYVGSGCFHRRETLSGAKYSKEGLAKLTRERPIKFKENIHELEERLKFLANCQFEENTEWGDEIGVKYGCPTEDVISGLSIQCRGWKSAYYNPEKMAFLGVAPTTLDQTLVQQKRWSEGDLQIFISKYSPVWYGVGRIKLGHIMAYCIYCLWSPNCLATIYYCIIPSLHLLKGIPLFPQISSLWFLPFHICNLHVIKV
ncbi:hypothetical protein Leryth_013769 [Lithospermum erythrorhizon]|nr:hypothetical protein Leryth_013769 [Lithospermum erythrorhizon]